MAKTVNQRLAEEAVRHRLFLARYSQGQANRMIALLRKADIDISSRLLYSLEAEGITLTNYTIARLERVKRSVKSTITDVYEQITGQLNADLRALSAGEAVYAATTLTSLIPAVVLDYYPVKSVPAAQLWAATNARPFAGGLLKDIGKVLGDATVRRIGDAVQQGIIQGETYAQITDRVRGTRAGGYDNGVMGVSRRDLATITRTAVSHVAAEARDEMAAANDDLIKSRQWLSTLDTHTSQLCIARDHLRYTMDKSPKPIGHDVPYGAGPGKLHFNCRSTETYVIKSWKELGIPMKEMSEGTRASMGGQVPASLNYPEWVMTQSPGTIERIYGVTRGQAIITGNAKPGDFYSDKGDYLSLKQLRELDVIP